MQYLQREHGGNQSYNSIIGWFPDYTTRIDLENCSLGMQVVESVPTDNKSTACLKKLEVLRL